MEYCLKLFTDLSLQELYGILLLRNKVFVVEQNCPYQDIDNRDAHARHLFIKDNDGEICACLRILDKGQTFDEISIGRLVVRKDKRGAGLAKQMILKAISFIHCQLHEHDIKIQAQARLKDFYTEIGFKPCSEIYLEDGIPHVEMIML